MFKVSILIQSMMMVMVISNPAIEAQQPQLQPQQQVNSSQTGSGATCYGHRQSNSIDSNHCEKALKDIVYDQKSVLDGTSNSVFAWHKTCVVNLQKKFTAQPSKQQVESAVRNVLKACPSKGGVANTAFNFNAYVYQAKDNNVYQVNLPICLKKRCHIQPNDCLSAFNRIPVDSKGHLTASNPNRPNFSQATSGNCTVSLSSTDGSSFRTSHPEINASFKALLSACGDKTGLTYFNGGTVSNNGDVRIVTSHKFNETLCR